ncbi:MAG: hypothetical protein ACOC1O_00960 [bacterium]
MTLMEEIQKNASVSDVIYLEEGIVFFKNSNKLKRLGKKLEKKHDKLIDKKDMKDEANALGSLIREVKNIAKKFEAIENKFKKSSKEERKNIREEYKNLQNEFKDLLDIVRKDDTKNALRIVGGLAIVAGILLLAYFTFGSLFEGGILANMSRNLDARKELGVLKRAVDSAKDSGDILGQASAGIALNAAKPGLTSLIRATNKDLVASSLAAGATVGGIVSVPVISKLKKHAQNDKTLKATIRALEDLKDAEKRTSSTEE